MKRSLKTGIIISIIVISITGISIGTYFLYDYIGRNNLIAYLDVGFPGEDKVVTNGRLYTYEDNLVVLELNGTYTEMGYAHGQLLGDYIKHSIDYVVSGVLGGDLEQYYELYSESIPTLVNRSIEMHSREIEAILNGAIESQADRYVPTLSRDWNIDDLWVLNTIQDWNPYYCSGFGVWNTSTEATLNGRTIIGRDLDFHLDDQAIITQLYLITIYRGNGSRYDVLNFGFPGMIACISAFNENGVWLSTDNSNGVRTEEENRTPMGISMRNFLEQEDGINVALDAQAFFFAQKSYSPFLFLLGSNESVQDPVVIIEGNDNEVVIRTGSSEGYDYVFLTNHQRTLEEPTPCGRYTIYQDNLLEFTTTGDKSIDVEEAIYLLEDGGAGTSTINCIVFFPDTLKFRIGYTRVLNPPDIGSMKGGPKDSLLQIAFSFFDLN